MRLLLSLVVVVLICCTRWTSGAGGKIDSHDLFVGTWNTEIRCSEAQYHELFPPRRLLIVDDPSAAPTRATSKMKRQWKRTFPCVFSVYPNGTFGLQPQTSADCGDDAMRDARTSAATLGRAATSSQAVDRLAIHGRWTIDVNPYCVTDRFYDDVTLTSYPRIQKKRVADESTPDDAIVQRLHVKLKCRLMGHFTANRSRFKHRGHFARARLSHGTLVVQRDKVDGEPTPKPSGLFSWWGRPKISATFSGNRLIPSQASLDSQSGDDEFL